MIKFDKSHYSTYRAHMCIARDLETDQEKSTIEEEHISLPLTRIVMCLEVDSLRDW